MGTQVRRGRASGPAEWFLVFLQARDAPPRARAGSAVGPAEWLLVFLDAAKAGDRDHGLLGPRAVPSPQDQPGRSAAPSVPARRASAVGA
ncbi:hypothetical protein J4573_22105 [Actinomadura barringtoniae]|uniref:Uncharacterized protein n=1 Tax=Actinomadura barringtoniae TaxID=1427535 RepID=A0A939T2K8_9ACTN|nr:hypothetical protein [Actinomadura barringtoniae]MBO2449811.1 hypothetical protein [Actinomadura barringtoniae]